jgi:hypothetical protein
MTWLVLSLLGLVLTWIVVRSGAALGTRSAPFLGSYRFTLGFASVLAPLVAAGVSAGHARGRFEHALGPRSWPWAGRRVRMGLSLALVDGAAGLTRSLQSPDNYLTDVPNVGTTPSAFLSHYTDNTLSLSPAPAATRRARCWCCGRCTGSA